MGGASEQRVWLGRLAVALGFQRESCSSLLSPSTFEGPFGLLCTLHMAIDDCAVRPEVRLPLKVSALTGDQMQALLCLQEDLLRDLGGYIAMDRSCGLVALRFLVWASDVDEAVEMLNVANGVAVSVWSRLMSKRSSPGAS